MFCGLFGNFLVNCNDKKGVLIYFELYLVECMFKKINIKSLFNLFVVIDVKLLYVKFKGMEMYFIICIINVLL